MKASKTQAVLFMYNMLLEKGYIKKDKVIDILGISNLTFRRYIQELRAFYYNYMNHEEIIYHKDSNSYSLKVNNA